MPSKTRPDPIIPDHEILRKIGGGAYGEVWLGRGVTGALRAVKVVWREDFEDVRGFEREFEGILKFEPMSRDHPGLVHILHVGRSPDGVSFYYYVMELGDDVRTGQNINPIEYEPRTLRADTKQSLHPQMDTATCIEVGLRLAEALDHLHSRGLAHRDVKPSNVIFLNGKAKLADIGLVAARDQRTFVGTEGFVPPEGPGSAQADVYSLGKVLYEIATGKDRLDFPELPDQLPNGPDRKRWLELNRIICDICEPRLSRRKITTAAELAEALKRLQKGKRAARRRGGSKVAWALSFLFLGVCGWAGFELWKREDFRTLLLANTQGRTAEPKLGSVKIVSDPSGAMVFDATGKEIDRTPTQLISVKVGETVKFRLELDKHHPLLIEKTILGEGPELIEGKLRRDQPPEEGQIWTDHLRNRYLPEGKIFKSEGYVAERDWLLFLADTKRDSREFVPYSENGVEVRIALAKEDEAIAYCGWLAVEAAKNGLLPMPPNNDFEIVPEMNLSFADGRMSGQAKKDGLRPFRVIVRKIEFGMVRLKSEPPGAEVIIGGEKRGLADGSTITRVKPGKKVPFLLIKDGYKQAEFTADVRPGNTMEKIITLEDNKGAVFGKEWKNTLGMQFVPMGEDLLVSKWETRVGDFRNYVTAFNEELEKNPPQQDEENPVLPVSMPRTPDFKQEEDAPIVYISRDQAEAFCKWLTKKERTEGRLTDNQVYRLPTDSEWSQMAGVEEVPGISPFTRDVRKERLFQWGAEWPPPKGAGNFADTSSALGYGMSPDLTIPKYTDGFPYTAPVGSFPPNELGIYDLAGNAQEWVLNDYQTADNGPTRVDVPGTAPSGVLRGGGWDTYRDMNFYVGSREAVPKNSDRNKSAGFRVVIARVVVPPETSPLDLPPEGVDPFTD